MKTEMRMPVCGVEIIREIAPGQAFTSRNAASSRSLSCERDEIQRWRCSVNLLEPWPRSYATRKLRQFGNDPAFNLDLTTHAESRMVERNLTSSDARHVLKNGHVYTDAAPAKTKGRFKYAMEAETPNSGGRLLRLVVIPCESSMTLKIVTIMWVD